MKTIKLIIGLFLSVLCLVCFSINSVAYPYNLLSDDDKKPKHNFTEYYIYSFLEIDDIYHYVRCDGYRQCTDKIFDESKGKYVDCPMLYIFDPGESIVEKHHLSIGPRTDDQGYHQASINMHNYEYKAYCVSCKRSTTVWQQVPCTADCDEGYIIFGENNFEIL